MWTPGAGATFTDAGPQRTVTLDCGSLLQSKVVARADFFRLPPRAVAA